MRRLMGTMAVAALVGGLFGRAATTWGQHGHSGGHEQGHQTALACATEFDQVVGEGRGFGMAFAADQNGYPGPMHVLELKDRHTPQDARSPDPGPAADLPPGPLGHPLT